MESIINSIKNSLNTINKPIVIYVGVGTHAGLMTEINGKHILEDKNYHQFPPCIQKIFSDYSPHIFSILIDPQQENPLYMVTDKSLNNKYFNSEWNYVNNGIEVYTNKNINIYPFRQYVTTQINKNTNSIDITNNLYELNQLCIDENITMIYHDFTGAGTAKKLEKYFLNQINNHLEHIIYGISTIDECYYDFTLPEAYFATKLTQKEKRKMIKIFNIFDIFVKFEKENAVNFMNFLNMSIHEYDNKFIDNIMYQIENIKKNFAYVFKNYAIYILRGIKNYSQTRDNPDIDYYMNRISLSKNIINLNSDNVFDEIVKIIADLYKNEIMLCLSNTIFSEMKPTDIIFMVTDDTDKYKWFSTFNNIFNV